MYRVVHAALMVILSVALLTVAPGAPRAEVQLQLYGGLNSNFSSNVALRKGAVSDDRTVEWEGKPFAMPPYWGARAIYW